MKPFRYILETVPLYLLYWFFKALPARMASCAGGWLGRTLGPHMGASRKASKNLRSALPGLSEKEETRIIRDMWDNLGRVVAEYPHLEQISREWTQFEGLDDFDAFFAKDQAVIFFSAHMSNWEVNGTSVLTQYGKPVELTYRALNNPLSDKLLSKARTLNGQIPAYPKSRRSGKDILETLKQGHYLGILIDQKYNEGSSVPFFDMPAMTNPIFVKLAQRYRCPLIPVQNIRVDGTRFRLKFYEPLQLFDKQDRPRPVEEVIGEAHALLESWIRENPGQWLWLHRRWPEQALQNKTHSQGDDNERL